MNGWVLAIESLKVAKQLTEHMLLETLIWLNSNIFSDLSGVVIVRKTCQGLLIND